MTERHNASVAHILAFVPNWMGDAAMCTPALRALHNRFPSSTLTVAGRSGVCDLLEELPWINDFERLPEKPSLREMIKIAARMHSRKYELIVVFPHSFRAALLAWLIGGSKRIGYACNGRRWLLTQTLPRHMEAGYIVPIYMAEEYLNLVKLVGCNDDGKGLELGVSSSIAQELREQLAGKTPLIGIAPGAAFGPSKQWMPEGFAEVTDRIASQQKAHFLLLTGPGEESIGDAIKAQADTVFLEPETSESGLSRLKGLISCLDLLICNDSGPRHIAVAFKRPVICIMGPTSPRYTDSPYEIGEVVRLSLECSPCQKPVCPLEHHRCMRHITPKQVADAALRVLQTTYCLDKD